MFNLKLPTMMALAALLIFAAAAITACGGDDPGAQPRLTDEQVREIDRLVYELYGLTEYNITAVGRVAHDRIPQISGAGAP